MLVADLESVLDGFFNGARLRLPGALERQPSESRAIDDDQHDDKRSANQKRTQRFSSKDQSMNESRERKKEERTETDDGHLRARIELHSRVQRDRCHLYYLLLSLEL